MTTAHQPASTIHLTARAQRLHRSHIGTPRRAPLDPPVPGAPRVRATSFTTMRRADQMRTPPVRREAHED